MEVETLLRLTVLSFGAAAPPSTRGRHQKEAPAAHTPHISAAVQDIRMAFINLWTESLGHLISINAFLRDTLRFFLPGHWSFDPCDTQHIELVPEVDIGTRPFAFRLEKYRAHGPMKQWAGNPFFQHLNGLVAQMQPKLPLAQPSFTEWLKAVDRVLASLRTLLISLHSAFFSSFADANKTLSDSYRKVVWQDVQPSYALAVFELSRIIDAKLVCIVAHTMAANIDVCNTCIMLQLFRVPSTLTPQSAADLVATVLTTRLGTVASSAAANNSFSKHFPQAMAHIADADNTHESSLDLLRGSTAAYVEKLQLVALQNKRRLSSFVEPFIFSAAESTTSTRPVAVSPPPLSETQEDSRPVQEVLLSPFKVRPVSLEDACALAAPPEEVQLLARVNEIAAPVGDVEATVKELVAKQREEGRVAFGGVQRSNYQREAWFEKDASQETTPEVSENAAPPEQVAAARRSSVTQGEATESYSSGPRETLLFWSRLQRTLALDEATLAQAMERCRFDHESPFPNVFLKDLDVRNNDRPTRLFVEEVRPLLALDGSPTMKARSARLFSEACTRFGMQLWEKTLEIREALPCLPVRVNGVLLGTLYAAMRADKQFESLKQVRVQLSQVTAATSNAAKKNAETMAHTESLLLRRVEILAKSVSAVEYESAAENRSRSPSTATARPPKADTTAKRKLTSIVSDTLLFNKGFCGSIGRYARASGSPVLQDLRRASSADLERRRSSVMEVLAQSRKVVADIPAADVAPGSGAADVYRDACSRHGIDPSLGLLRELDHNGTQYFSTLDLSGNYVGAKGLRAVLDLLEYNGKHLVSLSVCNNSLESDDVGDLCATLLGAAGTNLVHLDLSYNPFTSSAVSAVKGLVESLGCLETLTIKGTLLPPSTARELQRLPVEQTLKRCLR